MLGQLQTVQRVCCWWIRWQKAAALRLPAALLLHNICFLLNYSSPAAWPALHTAFCTGWGGRENCTYKPLFGLGGNMQPLKKGIYYLEPIIIIMSENPTIVQVFHNRNSFSPLQPVALKKTQTSGSLIKNSEPFL